MEQNEPKACRVCFDGEESGKKLINPCLCKGSSKYIHKECLYTWINSQNDNEDSRKCEVCNYIFNIKVSIKKKCLHKKDIKNKGFKTFCIIFSILVLLSSAVVAAIVLINKQINLQKNTYGAIGVIIGFIIFFLSIIAIIIKIIRKLFFFATRKKYTISSNIEINNDPKKNLANPSPGLYIETTEFRNKGNTK